MLGQSQLIVMVVHFQSFLCFFLLLISFYFLQLVNIIFLFFLFLINLIKSYSQNNRIVVLFNCLQNCIQQYTNIPIESEMIQNLAASESQQKNQQFKTQIRRRSKLSQMSKIRRQFMIMQQCQSSLNYEQNPNNKNLNQIANQPRSQQSAQLQSLLAQFPTSVNIGNINRILLQKREQISQNLDLFDKLIRYIKKYFIRDAVQERQIANNILINDFVALLGNLLAFGNWQQDNEGKSSRKTTGRQCLDILLRQFDFVHLVQKLLTILQFAPNITGALILWLLYQIAYLTVPQNANMHQSFLSSNIHQKIIQKLSENQHYLKQKFTLIQVNLSYVFLKIMEYDADMLDPQILNQYTVLPLGKAKGEVLRYLCENIIYMFDMFLANLNTKNQEGSSKNQKHCQGILKWVICQFVSQQFPRQCKSSLLELLLHIISSKLQNNSILLTNFLSQHLILYQLIQRSQYDNIYGNKLTSLRCLNVLIRISPNLQLLQLINGFPAILEAIVSGLSLNQYQIVLEALKSLAKIVMISVNSFDGQSIMESLLTNAPLKFELQSLTGCKNKQISNLAAIFLQDYFE